MFDLPDHELALLLVDMAASNLTMSPEQRRLLEEAALRLYTRGTDHE